MDDPKKKKPVEEYWENNSAPIGMKPDGTVRTVPREDSLEEEDVEV